MRHLRLQNNDGGVSSRLFVPHFSDICILALECRSGWQILRNLRVTHLHFLSQIQLFYPRIWKWVTSGKIYTSECDLTLLYFSVILCWHLRLFIAFLGGKNNNKIRIVFLAVWMSVFPIFLSMRTRCLQKCQKAYIATGFSCWTGSFSMMICFLQTCCNCSKLKTTV